MIQVEIYFGSLIIFLEVNKCKAINLTFIIIYQPNKAEVIS